MKKRKMKSKKKTGKNKVTKYQLKTFIFELHKTKKPEEVDEKVKGF